jgi:enoyl-CoA hydratase
MNSVPTFTTLRLDVGNDIAQIVFTRPDLLNRFDTPAHEDFIAALRIVAQSHSARVLIIAAEGRAFSAGGDFEEIEAAQASPEVRSRMTRYARDVLNGIIDLPIPVIAAVQGAAVGLGATIAGISDIVVSWRGAKIADTHVVVGIVAGDGGVIAWSQAVGINRAKRYLLTGDMITGEQAYQFGFVTELVDTPEAVLPATRAIAERLSALPADGVNGTKRAFAAITRARVSESFELGISLEMQSMTSPDVSRAIAGFRKRKPAG